MVIPFCRLIYCFEPPSASVVFQPESLNSSGCYAIDLCGLDSAGISDFSAMPHNPSYFLLLNLVTQSTVSSLFKLWRNNFRTLQQLVYNVLSRNYFAVRSSGDTTKLNQQKIRWIPTDREGEAPHLWRRLFGILCGRNLFNPSVPASMMNPVKSYNSGGICNSASSLSCVL